MSNHTRNCGIFSCIVSFYTALAASAFWVSSLWPIIWLFWSEKRCREPMDLVIFHCDSSVHYDSCFCIHRLWVTVWLGSTILTLDHKDVNLLFITLSMEVRKWWLVVSFIA